MRRKRIEPSWKSARFPLVGLAARLRSRRIYQDLKALGLTDSPCRPFLTQFPVGFLNRDGFLRLLAEIVSRAPREHCPSHPRDFVGQSDDGDILVTELHEPLQPYGLSVGSPSDKSDHCSSALDQHGSQVHVPAFRNATKRYLPAT